MPSTKCPLPLAGLDLAMMLWHTGMERSHDQWQDLLRTVGCKITNVWNNPTGDGAIIEAMLEGRKLNSSAQPHDKCRLFLY